VLFQRHQPRHGKGHCPEQGFYPSYLFKLKDNELALLFLQNVLEGKVFFSGKYFPLVDLRSHQKAGWIEVFCAVFAFLPWHSYCGVL